MILRSQVTVGDLTFDLRTAGEESNETVILLHGFPETSHMWIPLMKDLVKGRLLLYTCRSFGNTEP